MDPGLIIWLLNQLPLHWCVSKAILKDHTHLLQFSSKCIKHFCMQMPFCHSIYINKSLQKVEYRANRKYIRFACGLIFYDSLRCNIVRSSSKSMILIITKLIFMIGKSKINNFNILDITNLIWIDTMFFLEHDHNILRFKISMYNLKRM